MSDQGTAAYWRKTVAAEQGGGYEHREVNEQALEAHRLWPPLGHRLNVSAVQGFSGSLVTQLLRVAGEGVKARYLCRL